jgi:hypothetical protein
VSTRRASPREYHRLTLGPDLTREEVILLAREWLEVHGEPPRAADWSYGALMREGSRDKAQRLLAGGWPSTHDVKRLFGGWSAMLTAAGLYPRVSRIPAWQETALEHRAYWLREAIAALKREQGEEHEGPRCAECGAPASGFPPVVAEHRPDCAWRRS